MILSSTRTYNAPLAVIFNLQLQRPMRKKNLSAGDFQKILFFPVS